MELISPSFGLIFWMLIGFGILFFILAKFAWPVIIKMLDERDKTITGQLAEAEKVREEMKNIHAEHQLLLAKAKDERDDILAEARKLSDKMYTEIKEKANTEARSIIDDAKKAIHFEKMKAMTEIKNETAILSIEIAEKMLREELSDKSKQEDLINKWMTDVNLN